MRRGALLLATVVVAASAQSAPTAVGRRCAAIAPPSGAGATIAKVVVAANVLSEPGTGKRLWRAATSTPWGDNPTWLLVLGCAVDGSGNRWLRVALPIRPNGATGWIRSDFTLLDRTDYRLEISTKRADVSVYRKGTLIRHVSAVVGAAGTPSPHGLFAIYDPVLQPSPDDFVGPWVIHLTAHSDVLDDFGGGPGRVAIHGRSGASLRDPLGSARSHGCIRVDNDVVSWLARTIPQGTPVIIRR